MFMSVSLGSSGCLACNSRQLTSPPLFSPCFLFSSAQLSTFSSSSSSSHLLIHPPLFPPCLPLPYPHLPLSSSFASVSPFPSLSVFLSSSCYFCKYHMIFQINTKSRGNAAVNPHVFITEPQQQSIYSQFMFTCFSLASGHFKINPDIYIVFNTSVCFLRDTQYNTQIHTVVPHNHPVGSLFYLEVFLKFLKCFFHSFF